MNERDVIRIGNAHGKIAIYCNETEAIDIASHYRYPDAFAQEILEAVEKAYPKASEDEDPNPLLKEFGTGLRAHLDL